MAIPQQKFREIVFQLLYSTDFIKTSEQEMTLLIMKELCVTKKVVTDGWNRVRKIIDELPEIDTLIRSTSNSYRFERIQSVERNVLRIGIYELLYDEKIPPKVAISEALRLSKKFGTPESAAFVNALMDAIYQSSIGEEVNKEVLADSAKHLEKSEEMAHDAAQDPHFKQENA